MADADSSSLLHDVLDAAIEITGADMGNVQLLDQGVLKIVAQRGFEKPFLEFFDSVREGNAACGAALLRGERVIVEDVSTSPVFAGSPARDVVLAAGVTAVQSTPLIARSASLIGVFSTHFRQPHRPDDRELRLLDLLAHQAVSFIERADADHALQAKEQQLQHITDHVATMIAQCSRDLRYVFVNKACADFIGRPAERIIGQLIVDVLGAEAVAAIRPYFERALAGERVDFETEIPYAGKAPRYMRVIYVPDVDSRGTIRGWIGAITDITERKQIEDALINVANEHRQAELQMADDLRAMTRLQALSTTLVQAGDLKSLLSEILSAAADLTGTDKGNIQLYDPATGRLRIVVHQGLGNRLVEHFADLGWVATCDAAAQRIDRVIVEDVTLLNDLNDPVSMEIVLEDGIRAIQSTPLVSRGGRLLGMLSNHFRQSHRPDERALRWLDLLARMAADFIERSQAEEAVRTADRHKDEFLAMLAHELRNPLAPIHNGVQILQHSNGDDEVMQPTLQMLERQVDQMVRMVDDLLDVSRVSRGKIELRRETIDLSDAVNAAVESVRSTIDSMQHKLEVVLPTQSVYVDGDLARLIQVVGNLLSNACKFMDRGGSIVLKLERQNEQAIIRVHDSGIGIDRDQLERIFELFAQLDTSRERTAGGLGIGLTLVKSVVEMHGGTIEVHSAGRGQGSEFVIRLPISQATPKQQEVGAVEPKNNAPRRVLIVDDNRDGAQSLAVLLQMLGHHAHMAHDGMEALEAAERLRPDLVLLDIGLPKLSGYDACRHIRDQAWGRDVVLVAVTGYGQQADIRASEAAGFNHHLVKPVDYLALDRVLSALASRQ